MEAQKKSIVGDVIRSLVAVFGPAAFEWIKEHVAKQEAEPDEFKELKEKANIQGAQLKCQPGYVLVNGQCVPEIGG